MPARADIAAATTDAEKARASLDEARSNRRDLQVIAPFAGTVVTRTAEPGEVVTADTPIVTPLNLGEVYLRAFVPEGEIGRVKVGQQAGLPRLRAQEADRGRRDLDRPEGVVHAAIGLAFYALAWRATRRMQVQA